MSLSKNIKIEDNILKFKTNYNFLDMSIGFLSEMRYTTKVFIIKTRNVVIIKDIKISALFIF